VVTIASDSLDNLKQFEAEVKSLYEGYAFDDPDYRKAELSVSRENNKVLLKTIVSGAQHGSVPMENRENGANPLVSLTNFLAYLVENRTLGKNGIGEMCSFIKWAWGTHVFGEDHPDLLERHDDVFTKGNGTTYALTKIVTDERAVKLSVDIRYAIGHNSVQWDGKTEGLLPGESIFPQVFSQLVERFNSLYPEVDISFETRNRCTPDIRDPNNARFAKVRAAFEKVMGQDEPFPMHAVGGGTETKGHPELLAAGPLFSKEAGPPINCHGVNEGAPIKDLRNSARILYHLLAEEIMAH
jgi:succinyl-diaminopimelate desuccinylase